MEKIKQLFLRKCNATLIALLGMFGFSGCDNENGGGPELMYGTPHATFIIKGAVENIENDQPIEGIQVKIIGTFIDADDNERIIFKTKGVTDEDGHFKLRKSSGNGLPIFVSDRVSGSAHFSDIENEQFEDKTLKLDFEDFEQTRPAGSWFRGEFTKTLPVVQLTPRTDEDYEEENEAID